MNRELRRAIVEAALEEAHKHHKQARLHAIFDEHVPADVLPDGLSWYVEIVIDTPERVWSHGYDVQLTRDGSVRAYGLGPGKLLPPATLRDRRWALHEMWRGSLNPI